jgi:hypothetical protein
VHVNGGGNAEFDNMAFVQTNGDPIIVDANGTATLNNTTMELAGGNGVRTNGAGAVVNLNNSTIDFSGAFGIQNGLGGTVNLNNSVIAQSGQVTTGNTACRSVVSSAVGSQADDASCGTNGSFSGGLTVETDTALALVNGPDFNGGPSETEAPGGGSSLTNHGNALTCPSTDARFFIKTPGSCDVGAYQSTGAMDNETGASALACKVTNLNYLASPATESVTVTDGMSGIGPDAVTNVTIDNGGTVAVPTVPGTLFYETSPAQSPALDFSNTGALPAANAGFTLTAKKSGVSNTTNDTHWTFDATNWLGQTGLCH